MIRLSKSIRRYLFIAFVIYLMTIVISFLIYFLLILVEKRIPFVNLYVYVIGETILNGLNLFSKPLRYFLPNLSDDEYYLLLINALVTTFALIYAYLFCKLCSIEKIMLYVSLKFQILFVRICSRVFLQYRVQSICSG
jgi:hypothetical protein